MSAHQLKAALEAGDYMDMWRIMAGTFGVEIKTPQQAEIVMHRVRVETASLPIEKRAYSHAWLLDRGYPSGLPDDLKPQAERLYPRVVKAVGVMVRMPETFEEVRRGVESSMSTAVNILAADGVDLDNRAVVHPYMFEARDRTLKEFGIHKRVRRQ